MFEFVKNSFWCMCWLWDAYRWYFFFEKYYFSKKICEEKKMIFFPKKNRVSRFLAWKWDFRGDLNIKKLKFQQLFCKFIWKVGIEVVELDQSEKVGCEIGVRGLDNLGFEILKNEIYFLVNICVFVCEWNWSLKTRQFSQLSLNYTVRALNRSC